MKFNKIMIILIILLTTFMIGSVCASENVTDDNLSQNDITEVPTSTANENVVSANENEVANEINITFDQQMWVENLSDIQVQLPENANGTFCLKIGTLEVYNQTITNKTFNIPVQLPKPEFPYIIENIYPPRDCTDYKITAFYNDIKLNLTISTLSVMKFPSNYEYWWSISSEVLQYDSSIWNSIIFPRSANGIVEIYVDNKLINKTTVKGPYAYYDTDEVTKLALGKHTMKIIYYNDTYYHAANRTISFEVVNVKIDIPATIYISHNDCISVDVLTNTSGTVKVYIDNELVYIGATDKYGSFLLSLEKYLKYNSSEVKIEFIGEQFSREKIVPIDITYDFGYYDGGSNFFYGEDNIIELILPDYLNNSLLSVTVNGMKLNFTHPSYYMNNIVIIDISQLDAGNHTIVISYPGDARYTNRTESHNISVFYRVVYPNYNESGNNPVSHINPPSNTNDNFTHHANGITYRTVKLANGKSSNKVNDLISVKHVYGENRYKTDDLITSSKPEPDIISSETTIDFNVKVKAIMVELLKMLKQHFKLMEILLNQELIQKLLQKLI